MKEAGPDVVRFRFAITDLDQSNLGISAVTTVVPIGIGVSVLKKGATGSWAGSGAVAATVRGAIEALPMAIKSQFFDFLMSYDVSELMDVLRMVADRYALMPMEKDLVRAHLASHGEQLVAALQALRLNP